MLFPYSLMYLCRTFCESPIPGTEFLATCASDPLPRDNLTQSTYIIQFQPYPNYPRSKESPFLNVSDLS